MSRGTLPRRVLVTHAPPEAFAPMTCAILSRMGYAIVTPDEFAVLGPSIDRYRPDLRIVDERGLAEVPEDGGPAVPIVVLTGRHGATGADPRIVGAVRRPAGMHELYRLAQQALEDTPRSTPRVPTHLPARCRRRGREWRSAVLWLSENGCLMRSPETMNLGSRLELRLDLPRTGVLELEAEIGYQLLPDLGLIFHATSPADRAAISAYVHDALNGR
jgi:hypothetical protein